MEFSEFDQQNLILAENQPEYQQLPVNFNPVAWGVPMTYCIKFTPEDLEILAKNDGKLFVTQLTFGAGFQPASASIGHIPDNVRSEMNQEQLKDFLSNQKTESA